MRNNYDYCSVCLAAWFYLSWIYPVVCGESQVVHTTTRHFGEARELTTEDMFSFC